MMRFLVSALVVVLVQVVHCQNPNYFTKVDLSDAGVTAGKNENGLAWCTYSNSMDTKGWAFINIVTNPRADDVSQMTAAGYLEGYLSNDLIWAFYSNMGVKSQIQTPGYVEWVTNNTKWMTTMINENPNSSYWAHVNLVWAQLLGMVQGYNDATTDKSKALTLIDIYTMGSEGDLLDILPALNLSSTAVEYKNMDRVYRNFIKNSHCSSLVKVSNNFTELFHGHTTWQQFLIMTRMFKTYNFSLSTTGTNSKVVTFSSYPASIASVDDYYQMDTGIVVSETTNGVMNATLFEQVTDQGLLAWVRAVISNRMASSGADWVEIFSMHNSGTYNNQWIVSDHNRLVKGVGLLDGALHIVEQIPGYIESHDVTPILRYGYWPSFNVPYSEYIYNISGFPAYAKKFGTTFSYQNNPRGEIFRRDSNKIDLIDGMKKIMRYNDWEVDPLSMGLSSNAVSSRFDLLKHDPIAVGGVDSKVTSTSLLQKGAVWVQGGPTHDQQPPFSYVGQWESVPHLGQPTTWDFDWEYITSSQI